jgi:hypothetical protein
VGYYGLSLYELTESQKSHIIRRLQKMTLKEEGSEVRELVWDMSRMTNKILLVGIILILAIMVVLKIYGIPSTQ